MLSLVFCIGYKNIKSIYQYRSSLKLKKKQLNIYDTYL